MKILSAKYLIPMVGDPIFDGAIAIEGDEIIDVGSEEALLKRYPDAQHEDYSQHVILPGLINSCTQLDLTLYRDFLGDPVRSASGAVNYIDWLMGIFQYKRTADYAHLREAVERGVDECLQAGTTCVADMGSYEGVVNVLEAKGLRGVVFPEVVSFDAKVAKDLFESALAIIEKYRDHDSDLVSVGAGPHSPFTLSRNVLRIMSQYCRSSGIPLMMHVAESFSEMEFFYDSTGDIATKLFPNIGWGDDLPPAHHITPIAHLAEIGFLAAAPHLVGCVQVTKTDLAAMVNTGAKAVLMPRAAQFLQQGVAPYAEMREKRLAVLLGTGGIPSVNNLSLWDEMRAFVDLYGHQMRLTGSEIFEMVTLKAAAALGLEDDIGSLAIGKKADLIVVDVTGVPDGDDDDFLLEMVKNTRDYNVRKVIVAGRVVKDVM